MDSLNRVAIASRVFCLSVILGLAATVGTSAAITSTLIIALIAAASVYGCVVSPRIALWSVAGETILVALVLGLGLPDSLILLPYFVVLSLVAGLLTGLIGATAVMVAQCATLAVLALTSDQLGALGSTSAALGPWLLTGLGAGVLGAWLKQIGLSPRADEVEASYESARRLLTQLRTVARRLSAGLDPFGMSSDLLAVLHDQLQDTQSAVFVRGDGDVFSPLAYRGVGAREVLILDDPSIEECWARMEPTHTLMASAPADRRHRTVLPLRVGSRMIGVAVSASTCAPTPAVLGRLLREVDGHSMRIDTAIAFDEVRTIATADERQRLAREIHDGIAQEVASLGYAVDALVADATTPEQASALRHLRGELTRVVSELRLSIFDLRSEIIPQSGLGAALSDYVRLVGSRSSMTVHLTLDEAPTRLTAGVEGELFRIAQEAITNARKHSAAGNLWVDCQVRPPYARIEVRDDGCGLRKGRSDSFGLRIMAERASRIDAALSVSSGPEHGLEVGTVVTVVVNQHTAAEPGRAVLR